jgi:uncharacterized membrane protein YphA (DoxX/SURF4 family)
MSKDPEEPDRPWSVAGRVGFRFLFAYLALFFFPLPSGLADPEWVSGSLDNAWHRVVPWVGATLLHVQAVAHPTGSGDTAYDYVRIGCMAALAIAAAAVWSVLDRRRTDYRVLHDWMRLWLRYALAISMFTYGIVKVIKLQFPDPGYTRLTETYGESSPMGLLWTFMGFSAPYTFFAGASEILGALLLFFRRTTTLGALVCIGVMSNVVMLNFAYDVPVKIGSTHLLGAALLLAAPDAPRLLHVLVLNRPAAPVALGPHVTRAWMRRAGVVLKVIVIAGALGTGTWSALSMHGKLRALMRPEGAYEVLSMLIDGQPAPHEARTDSGWKAFVLRDSYARVWLPDRSSRIFKVDGDPRRDAFALLPTDDRGEAAKGEPPTGRLRLEDGADGVTHLTGTFEGHDVKAELAWKDTKDFPLFKRGFHWVSEDPYNR